MASFAIRPGRRSSMASSISFVQWRTVYLWLLLEILTSLRGEQIVGGRKPC